MRAGTPGSLQRGSGADGWHLSVDQVLNTMGEFRRGRSIVSSEAAQQMLDNGFGVDPFNVDHPPYLPYLLTATGKLYCKNGFWHDTDNPGHREEQSLAYFLPEDMELAVLVNSPFGNPEQSLRCIVTNVYLDHLTTQLVNHP